MPMPFGVGVSVVLSGSMEPALSVDDVLVVKSQKEYFVDDMVVFNDHGTLVVHRIISIVDGEITTKGDANDSADEAITAEVIKGKVVKVIPSAGKLLNIVRSPIVVILVLGAAILLMELSFKKEKKDSEADLEPIKEEIRRLLAEQEAAKQNGENKE